MKRYLIIPIALLFLVYGYLFAYAIGNQKPALGTQLDNVNSIFYRLQVAWWANEGGGSKLHDYSLHNYTGAITGPTWVPGGLDFSAVGTSHVLAPKTFNIPHVTIFVLAKITHTPGTAEHFARFLFGGANDKNLTLEADGKVQFHVFDGGAKITSDASALAPLNVIESYGATANGTIVYAYQGGRIVGSVAAGDTYALYGGNNFHWGNNANWALQDKMYLCYMWDRALSPAEMMSLHLDPYQIRPRKAWLIGPPSGAPAAEPVRVPPKLMIIG